MNDVFFDLILNDEHDLPDFDDHSINDYEEEPHQYKDSTYEIVSKVAYLIGVPKRIFENENQSPKLEVYDRLDKDKNARIIRHLCVIRNAIERGFKYINNKMRYEFSLLHFRSNRLIDGSIHISSCHNINPRLRQALCHSNKRYRKNQA